MGSHLQKDFSAINYEQRLASVSTSLNSLALRLNERRRTSLKDSAQAASTLETACVSHEPEVCPRQYSG